MQGLSRSTFLKEAVSRVYQEKVEARQRPSQSSSPKSFTTHQSKPASPAVGPPASPDPSVLLSRQRVKAHAAELRAKKQDPTYKDVPVSEERPMSDYKNVLERLEALSTSNGATDAPPVPRVPGGFAARLSRRMPKVTLTSPNKSKSKIFSSPNPSVSSLPSSIKEGSTPPSSSHGVGSNGGRLASLRGKFTGRPATPKTKSTRPSTPLRYSEDSNEKESVVPDQQPTIMARRPQVRDPVDLAMERLVAMGFDEQKAKKALAQTDSGNGIDFDRALTKLVKDKKRAERLERLNKMG